MLLNREVSGWGYQRKQYCDFDACGSDEMSDYVSVGGHPDTTKKGW
ncbi:hypothetical protein RRSWK_01819 [Rhodopirellula sp. SWK7]|nr:hypothetical protein RRSWK_01819 [Rhodopirellula sp. SWK7]